MSPTPPGPPRQFWFVVEQQVAAGLILSGAAMLCFITYTIPRQLDQVLANQKAMAERAAAIELRMTKAEDYIQDVDIRVTRLEAK
jgi:hypothetical protein